MEDVNKYDVDGRIDYALRDLLMNRIHRTDYSLFMCTEGTLLLLSVGETNKDNIKSYYY